MTITTSKVAVGKLSLGATPQQFESQIVSCKLVPSYETEDGVETLSGEREPDTTVESYEMQLTYIQDFELATGISVYLFTNAGQVVAYSWEPKSATGVKFTGTVQVVGSDIGGEVGGRLTSDVTMQCMQKPVRTDTIP